MQIEIGNLVKVKECEASNWRGFFGACACFFCDTGSNRIGLVLGPAPRNSWAVQFDTGQWRLDCSDFENGKVEVISASR